MLMREAVSGLRRRVGRLASAVRPRRSTEQRPRSPPAPPDSVPSRFGICIWLKSLWVPTRFFFLNINISVSTSFVSEFLRGCGKEGVVVASLTDIPSERDKCLACPHKQGPYGLYSVSSLESCESVTCSDRPDGRGHPDSSSSLQLRMNMYFLLSICLP